MPGAFSGGLETKLQAVVAVAVAVAAAAAAATVVVATVIVEAKGLLMPDADGLLVREAERGVGLDWRHGERVPSPPRAQNRPSVASH